MLTKISVRNFKRFNTAEVELGDPVIFIGPNNSGKTSILQALALWDTGLKKWIEKRGKKTPKKRSGVTINRNSLIALPVPFANLLWRELHVRDTQRTIEKQITKNITIDIIVEGIINNKSWTCGLEFDYANEESFYCRPLRLSDKKNPERMEIPVETDNIRIAYLPPMSGLATNESRLDQGAINVRIGEGRTAEVLRNLCYKIVTDYPSRWKDLLHYIKSLFGTELQPPQYVPERGEITLNYIENGISLDLSSSGRGLQQTLLLLAYMYANPGSVLLLDEPDAHLEILRQRQIYQILCDVAKENSNQIIAASHSEVLLNEAADRDVVIAFVGNPHRINDRGSQVLKSLKEIGFEHYYQAEQTGWVLYLEGSTDLAFIREFARLLGYKEAQDILERPYVYYVSNQPTEVIKHFYGIREAVPEIMGIALFDRLGQNIPDGFGDTLVGIQWKRREIESYVCYRETLIEFAKSIDEKESLGPIFDYAERNIRIQTMEETIQEIEDAMLKLEEGSPWDNNLKISDTFLPSVFRIFYKKLSLPNIMAKSNFHRLVQFTPKDKIDSEIKEKLDMIVEVAKKAEQTG